MRQLDVYVNDRKAGMLTEKYPGGGYCFQYETDYFLSDAPPISVTLSKRNKIYESALLFPFFANMLPEGANRKVICRTKRIYNLSESIGRIMIYSAFLSLWREAIS